MSALEDQWFEGTSARAYHRKWEIGNMSERIRGAVAAAALFLLFCAAAGTMATFLIPDFSADVNHVFVTGPSLGSATNGMNFITDGGSNSVAYDVVAGMHLAILGLLAIGIPLGICARVARSGNRWESLDRQWGSVFQMGFLFQLGAVLFAAAILLVVGAFGGLEDYERAPTFFLMLVGDVIIGAIALSSWRSLQERSSALTQHG
jgi:hypothetical protein